MGTILQAIYQYNLQMHRKNLYDDWLSLGTLKMISIFFLSYWPFLMNKYYCGNCYHHLLFLTLQPTATHMILLNFFAFSMGQFI